MTTVTKLAISLPTATARALEKARAKKRLTRSAAIAEAVEQWVTAQHLGDADRRYVEAYLRTPERPDESTATARAATAAWDAWE